MDPAEFRLLVDTSSDIHWMADCATGRLLYVSPAAGRLLGWDTDRIDVRAAPLLAELPARLAAFAAGDATLRTARHETELDGRDGALPVEIESTLVEGEGGLRLAGVIRDISARRDAALQQKRFASMVSHEFRTPLATIDGAIQRLEMTHRDADEATRKRYRKIATAVDRLLAMLDEYLSPDRLADIGRARQDTHVAPAALLEEVAAKARERGATVIVCATDVPAQLRCDPPGMRLCLEVLLDNAIKYGPPGAAIEIVACKASSGGIEFNVADGGAAIPADELVRLFDKGYRGSAAAGIPGSGLGLYMAKAIVDVHGGTLTVSNLLESGKNFRIWLPIAV